MLVVPVTVPGLRAASGEDSGIARKDTRAKWLPNLCYIGTLRNTAEERPTAPYYGGAAERLEADREKAGASDLCKG